MLMTATTNETTTNEALAAVAGRRFRGATKARALNWWNSAQNTIGYPFMPVSENGRCIDAFLRAAGLAR